MRYFSPDWCDCLGWWWHSLYTQRRYKVFSQTPSQTSKKGVALTARSLIMYINAPLHLQTNRKVSSFLSLLFIPSCALCSVKVFHGGVSKAQIFRVFEFWGKRREFLVRSSFNTFCTYNCSFFAHHHQREQNYASRREVAHIKSRKRCEKKSFTTSCARILAHILVSLVARESVRRNCGRARDRNFSRQKSGIVALFISQKRGAFAVEFSHPGVRGRNLSARFRNPS